jgi:hypothetical protein
MFLQSHTFAKRKTLNDNKREVKSKKKKKRYNWHQLARA